MSPDFDELVGTDIEPEQRERMLRAHQMLVAAGAPPELPPAIADPRPPEAEVIPLGFANRRRLATTLVLAAAITVLAFGAGFLTGHHRGGRGPVATIVMRGTAAVPEAEGSIQLGGTDKAGNWPMLVRVSNLPKATNDTYYTLWLTKKGRAVAPCGSFLVRGGSHPTDVRFTVAYKRSEYDGWVVTKQTRHARKPGPVLLKTV